MDASGANRQSLSNNDTMNEVEPAWSPDGTQIVYKGIAADNNHDIWLMNSDGTNQQAIETNLSKDEKPDWQPVPVCTQTVNANNDPLVGTTGDDVLCGDNRANTIRGLGGDDIILGLGGTDTLIGGGGNDIINGGPGTDTVDYSGAKPVAANLTTNYATGVGVDILLAVESLTGSSADDRLIGSYHPNVLVGAGGADRLSGQGGHDTLDAQDGVDGNDTVNGGSGSDTCLTDVTEAAIIACE
jgi:Ca2+-binding RTX toxin-like protein